MPGFSYLEPASCLRDLVVKSAAGSSGWRQEFKQELGHSMNLSPKKTCQSKHKLSLLLEILHFVQIMTFGIGFQVPQKNVVRTTSVP